MKKVDAKKSSESNDGFNENLKLKKEKEKQVESVKLDSSQQRKALSSDVEYMKEAMSNDPVVKEGIEAALESTAAITYELGKDMVIDNIPIVGNDLKEILPDLSVSEPWDEYDEALEKEIESIKQREELEESLTEEKERDEESKEILEIVSEYSSEHYGLFIILIESSTVDEKNDLIDEFDEIDYEKDVQTQIAEIGDAIIESRTSTESFLLDLWRSGCIEEKEVRSIASWMIRNEYDPKELNAVFLKRNNSMPELGEIFKERHYKLIGQMIDDFFQGFKTNFPTEQLGGSISRNPVKITRLLLRGSNEQLTYYLDHIWDLHNQVEVDQPEESEESEEFTLG
ncbi:hypothetical protein ACFL21_03390 [Patescibacteria group bacterium]